MKSDLMLSENSRFSKQPKNAYGSCKTNVEPCSADVLSRLSNKIEHMSSHINDLESKNKELKSRIKEKSLTSSPNEESNDPDNERDVCETSDVLPELNVTNEFRSLQLKLNDMTSEIDNLQQANDELRQTIRMLKQPIGQSSSKSMSQLLNEAHREKLSTHRKSESSKEIENQNEKLKMENASLVAEINKLKSTENRAHTNISEMEKEVEKLTSIIEKLVAELKDKQRLAGNHSQDHDVMPSELKDLTLKYGGLTITSDSNPSRLSGKIRKFSELNESTAERQSRDDLFEKLPANVGKMDGCDQLLVEIEQLQAENSRLKKELTDSLAIQQTNKSSSSLSQNQSMNEASRRKLSTKPEQSETGWMSVDEKNVENESAKIRLENEKLVAELGCRIDLKDAENCSRMQMLEVEKDLDKLTSPNERLSAELNSGRNSEKIRRSRSEDLIGANAEFLTDLERDGQRTPSSNDKQTIDLDKSANIDLRKVNERLSATTNRSSDHHLYRRRLSTKSQLFASDSISGGAKKIENENAKLKLENEKLVAEIGKLKNSENGSHISVSKMEMELKKMTSINEQLCAELSERRSEKHFSLAKELDGMPPDLRELAQKNEELRYDNERLLLRIRQLEEAHKIARSSDDAVQTTERTPEQNKDDNEAEPDWVPSNEDLVAEIEKLQQSKTKSSLSIRQMEKELKKLESINENLLVQLNDKEDEMKQLSLPPNIEYILKQNEELKILNGNISVELSEMKNSENLARSHEADLKEQLKKLAAVNRTLMVEINELKQTAFSTDTNALQTLQTQKEELTSPQNSSHVSILQIGKDLERLAALNESILAINDTDINQRQSLLDGTAPDVNLLLKKNEELKKANENLVAKVRELQDTDNRAQFDVIESKNRLETLAAANERLQDQLNELERLSSNERRFTPDMHMLKNENEKLKSTNDNLMGQIAFLEDKLQNIENRTATYLKTSSSTNEQQFMKDRTTSMQPGNDYSMEIDWMVADMKKLQSKNESLRATNEKLLSQISDFANRSNVKDEMKTDSEKISDYQLIYASNRNIEIEWMKTDMDTLQKKNEKLKSTNESLVAEMRAVKSAEARSLKNVQQMERDLLRLSAMNERLSSQLNDKRMDKKLLSKPRAEELDAVTADSADLLNKIEELTNSNECLASEISELKSLDVVKMRSDLRKLLATNESLKLQISELKLISSNDVKLESEWMAADLKKLANKNKKLNISNQNLLNEISEMRREFRSLENRANMNALQKLKEMEKLTAVNEALKEQINSRKNEKKNVRSNEIGFDAFGSDANKVLKKNDELKAANEKLLSVIVNLKNSEKLATSKAAELEKELQKQQETISYLQDTNIHLQDTIENYVEKDWSKPNTELERICQLILNEGIGSLNDTEFQYMFKWFCKSAPTEFDIPKTSRKNTARKHCRICHQAVDAYDKNCDCKQYEGKCHFIFFRQILL